MLFRSSTHICEIIVILAREYPSHVSTRALSLLLDRPSSADRLAVSSFFVFGFILVVVGGWIRKTCYGALGKFFTYQLGVLKDHKLITTGPYAVVRHPAYTGIIIANGELVLLQLFPGSYVFESGIMTTGLGMVFTSAWMTWVLLILLTTFRRPSQEDAVLRKQFEKE